MLQELLSIDNTLCGGRKADHYRPSAPSFSHTTALALAGFLAAAAALLAFNLDAAEGSRVRLVPLWTVSVSPVLPLLSALLGMDVWSDERKTGRVELLLTAPVRERDLVLGKFLGVWAMSSGG